MQRAKHAILAVALILTGVLIDLAIDRDNDDALFQRADLALYTSKQSGRNCIHFNDGNRCERTSAAD